MGRIAALILSGALAGAFAADPDPRTLVLESAGRYAQDRELERNYTFRERTVERRFDGSGNIASTESKVHDVINLYGRPYRRLVEKDGKPLSASQEAAEQRKIDKELAKRAEESDKDRRKRLEKDARELEEERAFRKEIAEAFLFTMLPGETVSNLPCYVIQADPKPGYKPRSRQGRALPKVKGKLWITRQDRRWVKAEVETIDTFSLGWFILRVAKGTRLDFEAERVGGEVWMPSRMHVRGAGRVAGLKKIDMEFDIRWSDFRKFSTDSRLVATQIEEQSADPSAMRAEPVQSGPQSQRPPAASKPE